MAEDQPRPYQGPKNIEDESRLLFTFFDTDKDGKVSREELQQKLIDIGAARVDKLVESIMNGSDQNGNGKFEYTEFWRWINGGKSTEMKNELLAKAVSEAKVIWDESDAKRLDNLKKAGDKAEKEADKAQKVSERASGERVSKDDFIDKKMAVGVSRQVAAGMFKQGDDDGDGEISKQEQTWLMNDQVASVGQVKEVFQSCVAKEEGSSSYDEAAMNDIVATFKSWDVDGDGTISCDELGRVLVALNPQLGEKSMKLLMGEIDTNGDGEVDIHEFVAWMSGENTKKKKMKKKAKEEQTSKIACAMHKQRSAEARDQNLQPQFEELQHKQLKPFFEAKKLTNVCNTFYPGPGSAKICKECNDKHAWICHGCGFISYYDECINDCSVGTFGWTCVQGKCPKKKCGCKKKPDFWQRSGFSQDVGRCSATVSKLIEAGKAEN